MDIAIISVGKLKEKHWREAAEEYSKRLSAYCNLEISEVPEAHLGRESEEEIKAALDREGERILKLVGEGSPRFLVALDVAGETLDSVGFATKINSLALKGRSRIVFVIGSSYGLSLKVLSQADMRLSFSSMTFPHQLARILLLEQLYRAFKINHGETYHK